MKKFTFMCLMFFLLMGLGCKDRANTNSVKQVKTNNLDIKLSTLSGLYLAQENLDLHAEDAMGQAIEINTTPLIETTRNSPVKVHEELKKEIASKEGKLLTLHHYDTKQRGATHLVYIKKDSHKDHKRYSIGTPDDKLSEESVFEITVSGLKQTVTTTSNEDSKSKKTKVLEIIHIDRTIIRMNFSIRFEGDMEKRLENFWVKPGEAKEASWSVLYKRIDNLPEELKPFKLPPR